MFYTGIYLNLSGLPSQFHDEIDKASVEWNTCNYDDNRFPPLRFNLQDGMRRIDVFCEAGFSVENPQRCGELEGSSMIIYQYARNSLNEQVPCTRTDVLEDVFAHELGHVYSLNDSGCSNYLMGEINWRNGSYSPVSLHDAECKMVDDTYYTEAEEIEIICAEDPDASVCETAPECEVRGTSGCSPIILDFLGDGFDLSGFDDPVNFDINANGLLETVGWTSGEDRGDDGFLAIDRNDNGEIDDGSELFGDATPVNGGEAIHGFEALYWLDQLGNANGWIDSGDPIYRHLLLWFDDNHNGYSERRELRPLAALGVLAIEVEPYAFGREHDEHGNFPRYLGRALVRRGGGRVVVQTADVFFVVAP